MGLIVLAIVVVGVAAGFLARVATRRAGARALRIEAPPGVVDERFVRLGGVEQWVSIRGERSDNPLVLVLHGGPGASYTVFTSDLRLWERDFTVVQWDRRGVGKTLGRNGKAGCGALTFAQMEDDCVELCGVLAARLPGRKVVLLPSSAGTMVGLPLAHRRPDLFAAYVGTDFNVGLAASEAVAGPKTLAWARAHAGRADRDFLERLGADPARWSAASFDRLMRLRDRAAGKGRTIGDVFVSRMLRSPAHSLRDLRHLTVGLTYATQQLFPQMATFDAFTAAPRLELPFFVFQGADDVFTPPSVAEAYCRQLPAPHKQFELLPGLGHMGAFAHPRPFLELLRRHVRGLLLA